MGQERKLLLIALRNPFLDNDRVMPPLGVMSLHSLLIHHGINSELEIDFKTDQMESYKEFTHFGISCMTPEKEAAYDLLRKIKAKYPDKKVIIGGPHPQRYLQDCEKEPFDHIVLGDGEKALLAIMNATESRKADRILSMPVTEEEMNTYPLPYRGKEFLSQYRFMIQGVPASTVLTSKGCPMACAFCEDAGTKVRYYSPRFVGDQIPQIKEAGFKGVMFFDDLFAISIKRLSALAEEIVKHDVVYRCFGHAKIMTDEMAKLLADTGCIEIGYGAESGSQKILDVVNKRTTVRQNYDFVEICNRHGIKVKAFVIVGLPGESRETVEETRKFLEFLMSGTFLNRMGQRVTNDFDVTVYFPYKGTKIRDSIDAGKSDYDLSLTCETETMLGVYKGKNGSSDVAVRTGALTAEDIQTIQKGLLTEFKGRVIS